MLRCMLFGMAILALAPGALADERDVIKVYFSWGSAEVTEAGLETIEVAAPMVKECERNGVRVLGHADTSEESPAELATARARAVRDALVAHGLADSAIGVAGKSDVEPEYPTEDNVREPMNRRAEIVLVGG